MSSIPSLYHQIETKLAHLYGTDQASALLTDIIKLIETMPAGTQPALSLPDTLKLNLTEHDSLYSYATWHSCPRGQQRQLVLYRTRWAWLSAR